MEDNLAIIGVFGSIPLIVWIVSYYRAMAHKRATSVMKQMVERGDAITPETVKALGILPGSPHKDLKTGMILIAVALALMIFGGLIPSREEDAQRVLTGIAAFPCLVGVVYVFFWFMFGRRDMS